MRRSPEVSEPNVAPEPEPEISFNDFLDELTDALGSDREASDSDRIFVALAFAQADGVEVDEPRLGMIMDTVGVGTEYPLEMLAELLAVYDGLNSLLDKAVVSYIDRLATHGTTHPTGD